jgi:uncharacterized protein YjiS (DUF1127 family)
MHTTSSSTFHSLATAVASGLIGLVNLVSKRWSAYRNRRMVTELLDFDDHMLKDIGLVRGDVHSAIASPYPYDASTRLRTLAVERRASIRAAAKERAAGLRLIETTVREGGA